MDIVYIVRIIGGCDPRVSTRASRPQRRSVFPPHLLTTEDMADIVREWCDSIAPDVVIEEGCAVCACLTSRSQLQTLRAEQFALHLLSRLGEGVTRAEWRTPLCPKMELDGPILHEGGVIRQNGETLYRLCPPCACKLRGTRPSMPSIALANGRWLLGGSLLIYLTECISVP